MGSFFSVIGLSLMGAFFTISTSINADNSTTIHFSPKPAVVAVRKHDQGKDTGADDEIEHISLRNLLETRCKSLFTDFLPVWYLFKYVATSIHGPYSLIADLLHHEVGICRLYIVCLPISRRGTICGTKGEYGFHHFLSSNAEFSCRIR
jgi:hypothetical protein